MITILLENLWELGELLAVGVGLSLVEHWIPITPMKPFFSRREGWQDLFWMVFTRYASLVAGLGFGALKYVVLIFFWKYIAGFLASLFWQGVFPMLAHFGVTVADINKISILPIHFENPVVHFLVLFLTVDLLYYGLHLFTHRSIYWRVHMLHHSAPEIDWLTGQRGYWLEDFVINVITTIPFAFFYTSTRDLEIFAALEFTSAFLNHANLNLPFGILHRWIANPRAHRWHHADVNHHRGGQNFGNYTLIWDHLFGTFYYPADGSVPLSYGLAFRAPYPQGIWGRLKEPLVFFYKRLRLWLVSILSKPNHSQ